MSKLYSIQESTLTDIGDALRSKYGETRIEIERTPPFTLIKSSKATGFNTYGGYTGFNIAQAFKCPGASYIKLVYTTNVNSDSYYIKYAIGEYTTSNFPADGIVLENATEPNTIMIEADVITIRAYDYSWQNRGYYIQATGYDANDNPIELEGSTIVEKEIEVKNTYSSADVAEAIEGLPEIPEPIVLSGDCDYECSGAIASSYLTSFGDTITTKDLGNTNYMFYKSSLKNIPLILNYNGNGVTYNRSYMFAKCYNLTELPEMTNVCVNSLESIFESCFCLREIPEDYFDNWNFSKLANTTAYQGCWSRMFFNCYSLRKLPLSMLNYANPKSVNNYSYFYSGFYKCYAIDELVGLPIPYITAWTSNTFYNTFSYCHRLKRITFKTNEDGSPIVVQWKSQIIDLSNATGVGYTNNYIYNSGITADKKVIDDATYQALKDDPDWFSSDKAYSRYNHDSAVETINSLPDTSAYLATNGGTNTIKFYGEAGSATDGGAINTMTEEEIAVAVAKGWTVTFV